MLKLALYMENNAHIFPLIPPSPPPHASAKRHYSGRAIYSEMNTSGLGSVTCTRTTSGRSLSSVGRHPASSFLSPPGVRLSIPKKSGVLPGVWIEARWYTTDSQCTPFVRARLHTAVSLKHFRRTRAKSYLINGKLGTPEYLSASKNM